MKWYRAFETEIWGLVIVVVFIGLFTSAVIGAYSWACSSRWSGTYETSYGPIQGCRVNVNGRLFPERNVREL